MIAVNYTSGTTGRPKGVVYTHRGAYLNAVSVALGFEITSTSWHLWTLPMFHCNGWSLTWGVTVVGGTHVCLGTFDANRALELADRYPVTHLCGAPVVLGELARVGAATGFVAKRPIRAAVGGAPPTKETIAAVQAMGVRVTHPVRPDRDVRSVARLRVPGRVGRAAGRGARRVPQPPRRAHRVGGRGADRRRPSWLRSRRMERRSARS